MIRPNEKTVEACYKSLGKWVRSRRQHFGITQADLAKRIGLSRPSLVNIEAGRHRVMLHTVIELQAILDPPLEEAIELRTAHIASSPKLRRETLAKLGIGGGA